MSAVQTFGPRIVADLASHNGALVRLAVVGADEIGAWPNAPVERRIPVDHPGGGWCIDIRAWHPLADGTLIPGPFGLVLPLSELGGVLDGLAEAYCLAAAASLLDDGGDDGPR